MLSLYPIGRSFVFVDQVWIEDIELVTLNYFRRWVFVVVMCLVVLVPLIAHLNAVEVPWLSWSMLASPLWCRCSCDLFLSSEYLLVFADSSSNFSHIKLFCSPREVLTKDSCK